MTAADVCTCGYRRVDHPRPDRHPFELSDGLTNGIQPPPRVGIYCELCNTLEPHVCDGGWQ